MNRVYLTPLLALLLLASCKKSEKDDAPFSGTQYKTLGTYNSQGLPDYLTTKDSISTGLLSFISGILPNGQNLSITHPELFTTSAIGDITVTSSSSVYMTFVSEASGLTNSIAFYT